MLIFWVLYAIDQVQLDRAKQATKSAILMNLESRMVVSEDIRRQILTYERFSQKWRCTCLQGATSENATVSSSSPRVLRIGVLFTLNSIIGRSVKATATFWSQ
ncbi:hypothetical protein HN51_024961 [Arachis hypogaea]|uniref:uncharacterized protein isoform X2 n=1 Tax=Arachis hypogaea TaxID=3818 RepID=UPI000DECF626|nr:mitochondrial-processing peptidase subunit alpha isoform X2 [Arachis hypogaea]